MVRQFVLTIFHPLLTNIEGPKAKKSILHRIFIMFSFELICKIFGHLATVEERLAFLDF